MVCINTQSNLHEITGQVVPAVEAGCNVICIAEKISYPWASDAAWGDRIDALAKKHGVSVLGTGINPGFMLDALIVMWSSVCLRVDSIKATRVNDLSPFGPTVMTGQGVGHDGRAVRAWRGRRQHRRPHRIPREHQPHSPALGWNIDRIEESREPIVTTVERSTPHVHVAPGDVAGCRHIGKGYANGELRIELVHPQQIHPHLEGQETGDYIEIHGDPDVNMANKPEIPGGKGTYASSGNYIPLMKAAKPGMLTVVDMPLPRFWTPTA